MKQRIVNKKLKNDILVNLWIKRWRHSIDVMNSILLQINSKDYNDHNSIWYLRFKIDKWMIDYEYSQIFKISKKNYNIKTKQVYDFLMKMNMATFKYHDFKKFIKYE